MRQQLAEMYRLACRYRFLPYHYLKHDLYLQACVDDVCGFIPPVLMRRYILSVNPAAATQMVKNKKLFAEIMERAGIPSVPVLATISRDHTIRDAAGIRLSFDELVRALEASNRRSVFIKPTWGADGSGHVRASIEGGRLVAQGIEPGAPGFFDHLFADGEFDEFLLQPVVRQHHLLDRMNPSCVNTVRISTLVLDGEVLFNGAVLRIGSGETCMDNWARGGFMMKVGLESGELGATARTKGVHGRRSVRQHPMTGYRFEGTRLPFWTEAKALVSSAAKAVLPLKHVGWDVAFAVSGPLIVEGNHPSDVSFLQEGIGGCAGTPLGQQTIRHIAMTREPSPPAPR